MEVVVYSLVGSSTSVSSVKLPGKLGFLNFRKKKKRLFNMFLTGPRILAIGNKEKDRKRQPVSVFLGGLVFSM